MQNSQGAAHSTRATHPPQECHVIEIREQAGAELGQAQLKLGLDFNLTFCRFGLAELN